MHVKLATKVLLLGSLSISCASVDGLNVDKSFTYQSLGQRGLIVTDVMTGNNIKLDGISQPQLKGLLESEVRDERDDFKLSYSDAEYSNPDVLMEFKSVGDLSPETLASLATTSSYVAFGVVNNDSVYHDESEEKNEKDKIVSYSYTTYREMTVTFKVYDLEAKKMVWSGDVNKRMNNSKRYSKKDHRRLVASNETADTINAIGGLVGALSGKKKQEPLLDNLKLHPSAPSQRDTLKNLFEDFADTLPKKGLFD